MSVQHRSRIKTVADYSPYLSDIGGCCPPDAEPDGALENTTYQECVSISGYFIPGEAPYTCPDLAEKGCCCACQYVDDFDAFFDNSGCNNPISCGDRGRPDCYNGGLREVTECECLSVGGKWAGAGTSCSVYDDPVDGVGAYVLCNPEVSINDIRWPGACCNYGECTNVCTSQECADIIGSGEGSDPDGTYFEFFTCWPEQVCNRDPADCADTIAMRSGRRDGQSGILEVDSRNQDILSRRRTNLIKGGYEFPSSCIYENEDGVVICGSATKKECEFRGGYWAGLDEGGVPYSCSSSVSDELKNYIDNNKKLCRNIVDSWEIGKRLPLGLNGTFVGIMTPKSSVTGVGSAVSGNRKTGMPEISRLERHGNIVKNITKSYAIIASNETFNTTYDAHTVHLRKLNSKDFVWQLPDLDTLSFLYLNVNRPDFNTNIEKLESNNTNKPFEKMRGYYLMDRNLNVAGRDNRNFVYIQSFTDGFTSTCRSNSIKNMKAVIAIEIKEKC